MAEEKKDIKLITFHEDIENGVDMYKLYQIANSWAKSNKDQIKIVSGIYAKSKNEHNDAYHNTIVMRYTGTPSYKNPQECKHEQVETSTIESTCTNNGTKTTRCRECDFDIKVEALPLVSHKYTYTSNGDATCLEDGTETGTCSVCGSKIKRTKEGSALGHDMSGEWVTTKEPTYTESGLKTKKCKRCDYTISEEIPMLILDLAITSTLESILIDQQFSQVLKTNVPAGEESKVEWTVLSGSLPDGLTLSSEGELVGIPTISGSYTFEVKASYRDYTATKTFTVFIAKRLLTVTFDPMDGECDERTRQVPEGTIIGELPTAILEGMNFGGWFTAAVDGLRVDPNFTVSTNITLYARYGESSEIEFGDATTQFNIGYNGDRTNYQDKPYDFYYKAVSSDTSANLTIQTGISSEDRSNVMSATNQEIKLYMKVTNNGASGEFDIGFDCDSYIPGNGDDKVRITRLENGVALGNPIAFTVTVDYPTSVWIGKYDERTSNRYKDVPVGQYTDTNLDTGYAFTMNNIFISGGSYTILEVLFKVPDAETLSEIMDNVTSMETVSANTFKNTELNTPIMEVPHSHDDDDCDEDHKYNYDFEIKWDEETIQEFLKMYDEKGVEVAAEHFKIKTETAESYYKKWKQ